MTGLQIVLTVGDSTLPEAQRTVVLDGLAAEAAALLAQYYSDISVTIEGSNVVNADGLRTHEINAVVSGAYFPAYGGS